MEAGNYVNLFVVSFDKDVFRVVRSERSHYPDFGPLRSRFPNIFFYAVEDWVYAFGEATSELLDLGFVEIVITTDQVPKLTSTIIRDAISKHAANTLNYSLEYGFSNRVIDRKNLMPTSVKEVSLFKGFEFRPVYLMDKVEGKLFFSVLIDMRYRLELNNESASYEKTLQFVRNKYGEEIARQTIREIRVRTGDLTPDGRRRADASRFRLDRILEFVSKFDNVPIYDGSTMHLSKEPVRVAVGVY